MWGCKPVCCVERKDGSAEIEVECEEKASSLNAPQCLPTPGPMSFDTRPREEPNDLEQPQYEDQLPTPPALEQPKDIEEPQYGEEPQVTPPLEEPAPSSQRVIVFTTPDSKDVKVTFTKQPIGIVFTINPPFKVTKVKGHAEELGVQLEWEFKSVDGRAVQGMDFKTLKAQLEALGTSVKETCPPVVVFTTPGGEDVAITFKEAPIGIIFNDKEFPFKTDKVKGHAEALGVQPGWQFKSIAGSPVEGKDFATVKAELVAISQSMGA